MGEPDNAQLAAILRSIKGVMYTADAPTDDKLEILPYIALAARRLEGEISEAKVIAAAKAACEATKPGQCYFPNCICEDAARKAIVAALEAAAREV